MGFSPFLTVISSATTPRKASEIHATHIRKKILSSGERAWSYEITNFQLWEVSLSFWQENGTESTIKGKCVLILKLTPVDAISPS